MGEWLPFGNDVGNDHLERYTPARLGAVNPACRDCKAVTGPDSAGGLAFYLK